MDPRRRILVAVDLSENAAKMIEYVGLILGGRADIKVVILHILPGSMADHFATEQESRGHQSRLRAQAEVEVHRLKERLVGAGLPAENVEAVVLTKDCPYLGQGILEEQQTKAFGTVVVGRREISRIEEFLLGSVSSTVVRHAKDCAVWVVE